MTEHSLAARGRLFLSAAGRAALRGRGPAHALLRRSLGRRLDPVERETIGRVERRRRQLEASPDVVAFEPPYGPAERAVAELCRTSSQSPSWAELQFRLLRAARPEACLELGTCLGVSASYLGAALELNETGRLVTVEGHPAVAAIASETIEGLGLAGRVKGLVGWFDDVLDDALSALGQVDYAFIDGHHQGEATLRYFGRLRPRLSPGAAVVFDDIDWSDDMGAAWRSIAGARGTRGAVDLGRVGIWISE